MAEQAEQPFPVLERIVTAIRRAPVDLNPYSIRDELIDEIRNQSRGETELRDVLNGMSYQALELDYARTVAEYVTARYLGPVMRTYGVPPAVGRDLQRFMYYLLDGKDDVRFETVSEEIVADQLDFLLGR